MLPAVHPRRFADQILYIVKHAEDRSLFADLATLPVLEAIADRIPCVDAFVLMTDRAHMPATTLPRPVHCYEELIEAEDDSFAWRVVDEQAALSLCYTSDRKSTRLNSSH